MKNLQVEVEGGELALKNSFGDIVIIPKKNRLEVEDMIREKCWACIDAFVNTLPVMEDYAEDGTIVSELYKQKTGKDWSTAKKEGLTDGSLAGNLKLRERLLSEKNINNTQSVGVTSNATSDATLNTNKYNIKANDFNEAFKMARESLGANQIFEYKGRRYGTNLKGETFQPADTVLSNYNMNKPEVKERIKTQNESVLSPFTSKNTVKLEPEYKDWEEKKKDILEFNKKEESEKIIEYKSKNKTGKNYAIVDKKKGLVHIYDENLNQPLYTSAIDLGEAKTNRDDQTVTKYIDRNNDGKITDSDKPFKADYSKGNKSTGAGKYYISGIGNYGGMPSLNMMNEGQYERYLKTGNIENVGTSFHKGYIKDDSDRVSNGCIRCTKTTLDNLSKYLKNSSEVFILPEEKGSSFVVKNGKLLFQGKANAPKNNKGEFINPETNKVSNVPYYKDNNGMWQKGQGMNTTPSTLNYKPIKLEIDEKPFKSKFFTATDFDDEKEFGVTKSYVKALQENKQRIMKAAKIDGDTYNDISKIAFGIYGAESNFGDTHSAAGNLYRFINKVVDTKVIGNLGVSSPDVMSKATTYGINKEGNSVGYTQIRWSQLNKKEIGVLKELDINSNKDFLQPEKSAIATAAILAIRYHEQLTPEQKKDIDTYLPKKWNTRPNYAQRVKENSKYLKIKELN
jgi:hypothetical protein